MKDSGRSYRGTKSVTKSGSRCLPWDIPELRRKLYNAWRPDALELGLGSHSFCRSARQHERRSHITIIFQPLIRPFFFTDRNPDDDVAPWCHTYKNMRLTWELCDIPKCCKSLLLYWEQKQGCWAIHFCFVFLFMINYTIFLFTVINRSLYRTCRILLARILKHI